jgi:hypothetical protein
VERQLGAIALVHFDRLFACGALEPAGGPTYRLKLYEVDPRVAARRRQAEQDARLARERRQQVEEEAARWRERNRQRREEQSLFEGLGAFSRAERLAIVEERRAALAESRAALTESTDHQPVMQEAVG